MKALQGREMCGSRICIEVFSSFLVFIVSLLIIFEKISGQKRALVTKSPVATCVAVC